ncbi:hypothetical protein Tsubulata_021869 [Turnera subulata]|uniref:Wall-associated receptor kinase galacturonan-binding domain-containing protein n=1 Tax=Turnera subulata TaxID=218843 RepID=A0A9Q0JD09_9ROSI|nr:hypothetical protein Tsubulata_021869 [Turnera subulata]
MSAKLAVLFQIGFLLLVKINQLAGQYLPTPKPGCPDYKCGNMTIPYPFGIGPKCYMSQWFDIECRRSSVAPANNTTQFTALIKSIKVEVVRFPDYSSYGAVTVRSPVLSTSSCPSRRREYSNGYRYHQINLVGSPFLFSTTNVFVAVGCNADASMSQETSEQYRSELLPVSDTTIPSGV